MGSHRIPVRHIGLHHSQLENKQGISLVAYKYKKWEDPGQAISRNFHQDQTNLHSSDKGFPT